MEHEKESDDEISLSLMMVCLLGSIEWIDIQYSVLVVSCYTGFSFEQRLFYSMVYFHNNVTKTISLSV